MEIDPYNHWHSGKKIATGSINFSDVQIVPTFVGWVTFNPDFKVDHYSTLNISETIQDKHVTTADH